MPEARACRSWHGYESGSTRSKKRPRNIGIDFGRLDQVMEGERENAKETMERKENSTPKTKKKKLSTQGPQNERKNGEVKKKRTQLQKQATNRRKRREPDTRIRTKKKTQSSTQGPRRRKKKIRTNDIKKKAWKEKRKRRYLLIGRFVISSMSFFKFGCAR